MVIQINPIYVTFQRLSYFLSRFFSSRFNPLYHLGAIAIFLLVIDVISGVYLFFFYSIDPKASHASVEAISQSFVGNIMRGLHRYSSDALILTVIAHMVHVIITDRFRMFRWIAWVTGILTLLIFLAIGISGYILVWDSRAQLVGILTAKFFSFLPVFGDVLMSAFFGSDIQYLGGLFRILLFAHIALTILIVFILWVHVMRNARPRLIPPKFLYITITLLLVILSIAFPAKSDPPAYIEKLTFEMSLDWFYLFGYPLLKYLPMSINWLIFLGFFTLLFVFPWLMKGRRNPPARIDLDRCTGCEQCYIDCPYEAITMKSLDGDKKAILKENKCAGCGICVGSCSSKAIDIPTYSFQEIIEIIKREKPYYLAFRCPFSAKIPEREGLLSFTVPCIGSVNALHAEELLNLDLEGLILVSCEYEDCYFREGNKWLEERYSRKRRPILRKKVIGEKILIIEAPYVKSIDDEVEAFMKREKKDENPIILTSGKVNYVLATIFLAIPTFLFYPLTTHKMSFYPTDKAALVLNFKYRSSPVKEITRESSGLKHMQSQTSIVKERSPVKVEIFLGDAAIYSKVFNPRGIRKDAAIFVYDELFFNPEGQRLRVRLEEVAHKKIVKELEFDMPRKSRESVLLTYDEAKGSFVILR